MLISSFIVHNYRCRVKAIIAHIYFVWIHPFGDGNGRTARLIEFQILLEAGIPTSAAHLLSNFYNQTRTEYYRQLDKTSKTKGDISDFIRYAIKGYVDELRDQLNIIRMQQWDIVWRNYVHDSLIETTISRDILLLKRVDKPALLRCLFELGCRYSGQIFSYQKMLGQLQDAGNTTTLAHYLNLLSNAGLLTGLAKFTTKIHRHKTLPRSNDTTTNFVIS